MAGTQTLAPLHKADLTSCTLTQLRDLTWAYYADKESLALVVAELEDRGIDPYA